MFQHISGRKASHTSICTQTVPLTPGPGDNFVDEASSVLQEVAMQKRFAFGRILNGVRLSFACLRRWLATLAQHSASGVLATVIFTATVATVSADAALEKRVETLLGQMTLEEKIGQMTQADLLAMKDKADVRKYALGSVLSGGGSDPADNQPATWRMAVEECETWALKTRLKIPLLYGIDAVHGNNNVLGAVIFPHNIGLGAANNPALVEKAARVTALEMLGTGVHWAFAPCVAVAQNPRWGRTYESFSDSPELVSTLGVAAVRGFQQTDLAAPDSALACVKHYLGDGGTRDGIDQGNTECDEATLRKIHLPPYAAAVKAGVGSVMASYSSWNGKKAHGIKFLLTDMLKGELGFDGFVVSDWAAIDQITKDYRSAIETSINAGLDMIMIPNGTDKPNNYVLFITQLKDLVQEGKVPQARVDDAARRILRIKMRMGLFEHPLPNPTLLAQIGSAEHRQAARECVRASLVLLKNSNNVLPLSKQAKRIHVVGKAADDLGVQCGGWTISWQGDPGNVTPGGTTILAALRKTMGSDTKVTFSADGSGAQGADVVVAVIGEPPYAEMKGDRADLNLSPAATALVAKAKEAGVPVVTTLLSGRPLVLGATLEKSDAFVAAWLPGTEGQGVADVLFGDYKPTGKLPRIWPRDNAHLISGEQTAEGPLFPRGFGLSYGGR